MADDREKRVVSNRTDDEVKIYQPWESITPPSENEEVDEDDD